ncbi:MAG TPA: 2-hydroxychromene-2-carboxylate isomerase [Solirubrobacteraceae bacterium]|nr:2-hydroxychromene-2-carboxylate isomerase [Solirubrobacteraceae bacterium]
MTAPAPELYFDLGSPYAYLAVERVKSVLGRPVTLVPVLVGAIFGWRGRGSWALTGERAAGMAEIERRAAEYGLPPMDWPADWPANALSAMRCATWAARRRRLAEFAHVVARRQWTEGADIADRDVLAACAVEAGLDPTAMLEAIQAPELKEQLRAITERAWQDGVRGVPTLRLGGQLFFGDDRLEEAQPFMA